MKEENTMEMDFDEIAALLCDPNNVDFICLALRNEIVDGMESLDLVVDLDNELSILEREATVEELENAKKTLSLLLEFASPEFQDYLTREDFEQMKMEIPDCLSELKIDEILDKDRKKGDKDKAKSGKLLKFPLKKRRKKKKGGKKNDKKD
ncbi:hypothetical protein ACFL29_01990 [Patescibacteria group bacterium]